MKLLFDSPKVLDLFAGAGGTGLGFLNAGFEIVGAIDIDPVAAKTYERNLGVKPVVADLQELAPSELSKLFNIKPYELDVLVGCPPCQGFTRMRNSAGISDVRNGLVLRYLEFVEALMPKFVLFENVPGIVNTEHGQRFYNALKDGLSTLHYIFDDVTLDAADYGVAQHRQRVILIGNRDKCPIIFPEPTHGDSENESVKTGLRNPWLTVREAIGDLPSLGAGEKSDIPNHFARSFKGNRVLNFIKLVPRDGGGRLDVAPEFWLDCHKKENCGHRDVYGRLSWDKPSGVMTSGCGNVSKGRFVHPEQHRGITHREAARLQSFPDSFVFEGYTDQVSLQIGNSVPPKLAEAIAIQIYMQLRSAETNDSTAAVEFTKGLYMFS